MSPEHLSQSRKPRVDGVQARERVLSAALRLFAERGYASTPVRDIAQAAGVNTAAIHYYFGDKAGLYRAALIEPLQRGAGTVEPFDAPGLTLRQALALYMRACLQPLGQGADTLLSVRLRFRESIEPTGLLQGQDGMREQVHARLAGLLQRHLGLAAPDRELQALTVSIFALIAYHYYGRDKIRAADPGLLDAPDAIEGWATRLAGYAAAMVDHEAARRAGTPVSTPTTNPANPGSAP